MSAEPALAGLPRTATGLTIDEYIAFVREEYLAGFVRRGGAAVKLAVTGDDAGAARFHAGLAQAAAGQGFVYAAVDAAVTRVHMVDQVFFAVSRQVDWLGLAGAAVRAAYEAVDLPAPRAAQDGGRGLRITAVAAAHEVNPAELHRSIRRHLEHAVLGDATLAREFRLGMLRLCQAVLGRGDVDDTERAAVLGWLRGDKVPAAALRSVSLYNRISRHNARPMLTSLARFLAATGSGGLVLDLDLARVAVARRPPPGQRDGLYYSKAATLDAYEVLRQLIDSTDSLTSAFVAAVLPRTLLTDEARGLPSYAALQLRVADEVRDSRRANPYAALVRLDGGVEGVQA